MEAYIAALGVITVQLCCHHQPQPVQLQLEHAAELVVGVDRCAGLCVDCPVEPAGCTAYGCPPPTGPLGHVAPIGRAGGPVLAQTQAPPPATSEVRGEGERGGGGQVQPPVQT